MIIILNADKIREKKWMFEMKQNGKAEKILHNNNI